MSKLDFALQLRACKWVCLTDEELQAQKSVNLEWDKSGQQVYVPRHKIVSMKHQQAYRSAELVDTDDEGTIGSGTPDVRISGTDVGNSSTEGGNIGGTDGAVAAGEVAATTELAVGVAGTALATEAMALVI